MDGKDQLTALQEIQHMKQMMERSSRFISLSGLSGIAAGVCALIGAWFAYDIIGNEGSIRSGYTSAPNLIDYNDASLRDHVGTKLFGIAIATFITAFILAFVFTYIRSRNKNIPIWSSASRRLMINVSIPMLIGGFFLLKMIDLGVVGLIAPGCLIFYGLALVNGSKYTIGEVRYLGYGQLVLGLLNCLFIGYGLFFWAAGFGVLHIIYGALMWWKYEK